MRICPSCGNLTEEKKCPQCGAQTIVKKSFVLKSGEELVGKVFNDKYKIEKILGKGAMGIVYKATQLDIGKPVALKIMKSDIVSGDVQLQRFYREAKAASKLMHPNTIKIYEFGQFEEGYPFIAMEYLDGDSLYHVIKREAPIATHRVLRIAIQIAKSLAEAHQNGIIHRDLKPQNIFLKTIYGEEDFVKVLDFGIAKFLKSDVNEQLTQTGYALGTPHYMAPEQAKGQTLDARSDLYSLGVIMFEMLTGSCPFKGETAIDIIMKHINTPPPLLELDEEKFPVTVKLLQVVYKLLEKDKELRIQSAEELIKILRPLEIQMNSYILKGKTEKLTKELVKKSLVERKKDEPKREPEPDKTISLDDLDIDSIIPGGISSLEDSSDDSGKEQKEEEKEKGKESLNEKEGGENREEPEEEDNPEATVSLNAAGIPGFEKLKEAIESKDKEQNVEDAFEQKTIGLDEASPDFLKQVEELKKQAEESSPEEEDVEKTSLMSIDAESLVNKIKSEKKGAEADEQMLDKTVLFDDLTGGHHEVPSSPDGGGGSGDIQSEKTVLFDLSTGTPATGAGEVDQDQKTVMFDSANLQQGIGQDEKTVMFDSSSMNNLVGQDEKTVLFDASSVQTAGQDEKTVLFDSAVSDLVSQDEETVIFTKKDIESSMPKRPGKEGKTLIAGEEDIENISGSPQIQVVSQSEVMRPEKSSNTLIWIMLMVGGLLLIAAAFLFIFSGE